MCHIIHNIYIYMYICMCIYMYIYIYTQLCIYIYIYIYIYIHIHNCVYVHMYICIYMYTYTYYYYHYYHYHYYVWSLTIITNILLMKQTLLEIVLLNLSTQNTTTTCVPSLFCSWSKTISEVVVRRALGFYYQQTLIDI